MILLSRTRRAPAGPWRDKRVMAVKKRQSRRINGDGDTGPRGARRTASDARLLQKNRPSYIVGMGGSAGGLEAFEQFFTHMPANSGFAFVLVPHLDPTHKGMMPELLGGPHEHEGRGGGRRHVRPSQSPLYHSAQQGHGDLPWPSPSHRTLAPRGVRVRSIFSFGTWPRIRKNE